MWLNFLGQNQISDANWAVSDKREACAALAPGASASGGWADEQLTASGRWMRAHLRGDPLPSPSPTPSPGPGCCMFGADCGDCGDDGTGWCHQSASNCDVCTGSFDSSASAPDCGGPSPSPPSPPAPVPSPGPPPPVPSPGPPP